MTMKVHFGTSGPLCGAADMLICGEVYVTTYKPGVTCRECTEILLEAVMRDEPDPHQVS